MHLLKGGVLLLLGTIVFSQLWALPAQARTRQGSLGNGYYVVMQDDADLLDQDEEEALMDLMDQITAYGNAHLSPSIITAQQRKTISGNITRNNSDQTARSSF